MLVEHGFVRAQLPDGREWSFTPSFGRIAELGDPFEIVRVYAALHGERAAATARDVLATLCDQEDATPLLGWLDEADAHPGAMPAREQIILARHLMQHGICGKADPKAAEQGGDGGRYSSRFEAGEFIAMARVHLGMSEADAAALSMTALQQLMAAKFPDQKAKGKNVPSRAEYEAAMARMKKRREGAPA